MRLTDEQIDLIIGEEVNRQFDEVKQEEISKIVIYELNKNFPNHALTQDQFNEVFFITTAICKLSAKLSAYSTIAANNRIIYESNK